MFSESKFVPPAGLPSVAFAEYFSDSSWFPVILKYLKKKTYTSVNLNYSERVNRYCNSGIDYEQSLFFKLTVTEQWTWSFHRVHQCICTPANFNFILRLNPLIADFKRVFELGLFRPVPWQSTRFRALEISLSTRNDILGFQNSVHIEKWVVINTFFFNLPFKSWRHERFLGFRRWRWIEHQPREVFLHIVFSLPSLIYDGMAKGGHRDWGESTWLRVFVQFVTRSQVNNLGEKQLRMLTEIALTIVQACSLMIANHTGQWRFWHTLIG